MCKACLPLFRAFLCLKKAKSILKPAQRFPAYSNVFQPPLGIKSLISLLALHFPFFIKEQFPRSSEKKVAYRFIATMGKNTLFTTKMPYKCSAFVVVFSLLLVPWCFCAELWTWEKLWGWHFPVPSSGGGAVTSLRCPKLAPKPSVSTAGKGCQVLQQNLGKSESFFLKPCGWPNELIARDKT